METVFADYLVCLEALHADLAAALEGLSPEALDWSPGAEMNSLSVLAAHTAGAERYLIGEIAGGEPVARDRDAEFRPQGASAAELQARLAAVLAHSRGVLARFTLADLERPCAPLRNGRVHSLAYILDHALDHTALHLGHMQITRQLADRR